MIRRSISITYAALFAATACSSEFSGTADNPGGSGGAEASTPGAGGSNAGGSNTGGRAAGGRTATGGSLSFPEAGSPDATPDTGAPPPPPPIGKTCLECASTGSSTGVSCAAVTGCQASPTCKPWLDCVSACKTDVCAKSCDDAHTDVAPHRYRVYECLCNACESKCAPIAVCDRKCDDSTTANLPVMQTPPATLAETGLYVRGTTSAGMVGWVLAPYVKEYHPAYELWSDGAIKKRWIYIPACTQVNTSDMDHWDFPVGTRLFKEFNIPAAATDPNAATRVETRLIHRFGPGPDDWIFAAYQWQPSVGSVSDSPDAAMFVENGLADANGTSHDIPSVVQCKNCHTKLPERILSFSAIQLSHSGSGETMQGLSDAGWLSVGARAGFHPPGDAVAQAALGYLHANCGNCHNNGFKPVEPPPLMRVLAGDKTVESTGAYQSLVGVQTVNTDFAAYERIEAGNADRSEIIMRMKLRPPDKGQMPPIATEILHPAGINAVTAWIKTLSPRDH
jgi:hypothetical protein